MHNLCLFFVSLVFCLPVFGERPVRILYYQAGKSAPTEAFLYANGEALQKTELPRHNFTKNIEVPKGDVVLSFLSKALAEGEKPPKNAPSLKLPESWQKALILVFENEKNSVLPIRVKGIDASDNVFGPGSVYLINFSELQIAGKVGDKDLKLKPKSFEIVKNPINKDGFYATQLFSAAKGDKRPRRFIKQMWQRDSKTRQLLFILPKPPPTFATYYCAPVRDF